MPKQLFFAAMLTPRRILWRSCNIFPYKRRERVENSTRSFDNWGSRGTRRVSYWANTRVAAATPAPGVKPS